MMTAAGGSWRGWGLMLLLAMIAWVGCDSRSKPAQPQRCVPCDDAGTPVVDRALMAFLSKAKAVHQRADIAESDGDVPTAIAALSGLMDDESVRASTARIEVREVLADTAARLAGLLIGQGELAGAEKRLRRALSWVPERDLYRGRLMEMLGACNEAVWKKRKQQGRHKEAAEAKREALEALKEAIAIQDDVLKRLLPPAAGKGGTRPAR